MAREQSGQNNWSDQRERVLVRDKHQCRFCGMTEDEHREVNNRSLDVHHIIPRDDSGEDCLENLVALCRSCHRTLEALHGQAIGSLVNVEPGVSRAEDRLTAVLHQIQDVEEHADCAWNRATEEPPLFQTYSDGTIPHYELEDFDPYEKTAYYLGRATGMRFAAEHIEGALKRPDLVPHDSEETEGINEYLVEDE